MINYLKKKQLSSVNGIKYYLWHFLNNDNKIIIIRNHNILIMRKNIQGVRRSKNGVWQCSYIS
jgi:hypothetical protein